MAGVPAAARANQGAARYSVKVSATSLRQMKPDQSGCSPAAMRPTNTFFASTVTAAATAPAASSTSPPARAVSHQPGTASRASAPPTARCSTVCSHTGIERSSSQPVRARRRRAGGS